MYLFVTNAHRSGAGHVTSQIHIHRVSEPTGPVLASCPHRNTVFLITGILSPVPAGPVPVM